MSFGRISVYVGWFFLLLGILGFVPGITTAGGYLFGIFHVNGLHNLIHLITGVIFLWAGLTNECYSLRTFQVFTFIYGFLTLVGLYYVSRFMVAGMAMNGADTVLHFVITIFTLYYGYLSGLRRTVQCPA